MSNSIILKNMECPCCSSKNIKLVDRIQSANIFAGIKIDLKELGIENRYLYECTQCYLKFSYPYPDESVISMLYEKAPVSNWNYQEAKRVDWLLTYKILEEYYPKKNLKLLDIGCWDGSFLDYIKKVYKGKIKPYGIEINKEARKIAESKGLIIISNNINNVKNYKETFDVITAFDIIEHIINPYSFLERSLFMLKKGGLLILSTGDANTLGWKIVKGRYYYCSLPEHVSFINRNWLKWYVNKKNNLNIKHIKNIRHLNLNLKEIFYLFIINFIYYSSPSIYTFLRKFKYFIKNRCKVKDISDVSIPPWFGKDHIFVVLQKI